jgi:hypothetical protein
VRAEQQQLAQPGEAGHLLQLRRGPWAAAAHPRRLCHPPCTRKRMTPEAQANAGVTTAAHEALQTKREARTAPPAPATRSASSGTVSVLS